MNVDLIDKLEALLFVASEPVPLETLARAVEKTEGQVEQALEVLQRRLDHSGALQVIRIARGYQLCTKPEHAETVANFLQPQRNKLGRALMEVLAIVAYRQPLTLAEIDQIRGVHSDYGVRQLLERRLIQEVGRKEAPGRPVLYGTTDQFLHQFKLDDLSQLPPIDGAAPITMLAI
jgi:segregation and condensation protein B